MLRCASSDQTKAQSIQKTPCAFGYATYPHLIHTEWFVDVAQKQHTAGRALIAKAVDKKTGRLCLHPCRFLGQQSLDVDPVVKGAVVSPFVLVRSGETFTLAGAASWENACFDRPSPREAAALDDFNLKIQKPSLQIFVSLIATCKSSKISSPHWVSL
jgi:hypothetical protein